MLKSSIAAVLALLLLLAADVAAGEPFPAGVASASGIPWLLAALAFLFAQAILIRLSFEAPSGRMAVFPAAAASIPLLAFAWRSSFLVFEGGFARRFALGGVAPMLLGAVCTLAVPAFLLALRRLAARRGARRTGVVAVLFLLCAALTAADVGIEPTRYHHLHDLLRVAIAAMASAALIPSLGLRSHGLRPGRDVAVAAAVFILLIAAAKPLREASAGMAPEARRALGVEWRHGRTLMLWLLAPARALAPESGDSEPGLSDRARRDSEARDRAREKIAGSRPSARPNVLMLTIDALRADSVGFLGAGRNTTPFLDGLAQRSFVFTRARSPTVTSFLSIASIHTGLAPFSIHEGRGAMGEGIAGILERESYGTAAAIPPDIYTTRDISWPGGRTTFGFGTVEELFRTEQAVPWMLSMVDRFEEQGVPWFVWAHVMDPHFPYVPYSRVSFGRTRMDLYHGEIRRTDDGLADLWEQLEERGLAEDLIVVVTSDHGEAFGEDGQTLHGGSLHEPQIHVPLLIRVPWLSSPGTVDAPVVLTSLLPTLVDLLGIEREEGSDAASLLPLMLGGEDPHDPAILVEMPIASQYAGMRPLTALITDRFKLVHDLFVGDERLFELAASGRTISEIPMDDPQVAGALRAERERILRDRRHGRAMRSHGGGTERPEEYERARDALAAGEVSAVFDMRIYLESDDPGLRRDAAEAIFEAWCRHAHLHPPNVLFREDGAPVDPRVDEIEQLLLAIRGDRPLDEPVLAILEQGKRSFRSAAAKAIFESREYLQGIEALSKARLAGRFQRNAIALDSALGLRGDREALARLGEVALRSVNLDEWVTALRVLLACDDRTQRARLAEAAPGRSNGWRQAYFSLLAPQSDREVAVALEGMDDLNSLTRLTAASSFLAGPQEGRWPLLPLFLDGDPVVREEMARRILERRGAGRVDQVLLSAAISPGARGAMMHAALSAIGRSIAASGDAPRDPVPARRDLRPSPGPVWIGMVSPPDAEPPSIEFELPGGVAPLESVESARAGFGRVTVGRAPPLPAGGVLRVRGGRPRDLRVLYPRPDVRAAWPLLPYSATGPYALHPLDGESLEPGPRGVAVADAVAFAFVRQDPAARRIRIRYEGDGLSIRGEGCELRILSSRPGEMLAEAGEADDPFCRLILQGSGPWLLLGIDGEG